MLMFASASDGFALGQQPFIDRAREPQTDSNQYWFLLLIWIASFFAHELLCVCFCVFASLCVCCSESDQLEDTPLSASPINHIRLSVFGVLLFLVICLTGLYLRLSDIYFRLLAPYKWFVWQLSQVLFLSVRSNTQMTMAGLVVSL